MPPDFGQQCNNGHIVRAGADFCTICGAPAGKLNPSIHPDGSRVQDSTDGTRYSAPPLTANSPTRRRRKQSSQRKIAAGALAVLVIAGAILLTLSATASRGSSATTKLDTASAIGGTCPSETSRLIAESTSYAEKQPGATGTGNDNVAAWKAAGFTFAQQTEMLDILLDTVNSTPAELKRLYRNVCSGVHGWNTNPNVISNWLVTFNEFLAGSSPSSTTTPISSTTTSTIPTTTSTVLPTTTVTTQANATGIRDMATGNDASGIAASLSIYFSAINSKNYSAAYAKLGSPSFTEQSFAANDSTTSDSHIELTAVSNSNQGGEDFADVSFTSHQAASFGPNGDTCDKWTLQYVMEQDQRGLAWLITQTRGQGGTTNTTC